MNNDWLYIGVFLNDNSKLALKKVFSNEIPENWRVYCEHMTLIFNDKSEKSKRFDEIYSNRIGEKCSLKVSSWGYSDKAIAVKIQEVNNLPCANSIRHITIAVSPQGKPVDSNYIENWIPVNNGMILQGEIKKIFKKH